MMTFVGGWLRASVSSNRRQPTPVQCPDVLTDEADCGPCTQSATRTCGAPCAADTARPLRTAQCSAGAEQTGSHLQWLQRVLLRAAGPRAPDTLATALRIACQQAPGMCWRCTLSTSALLRAILSALLQQGRCLASSCVAERWCGPAV